MAIKAEHPNGDGWLLSDAEYQQLKADSDWLTCLQAAGVDNWSGYDYAIQLQDEDED